MTALEFMAHGFRFVSAGGELSVETTNTSLVDTLREEVKRRLDTLIRPGQLGAEFTVQSERRAGSCVCCEDPLAPGRGAMCHLCHLAVQKHLRERGLL